MRFIEKIDTPSDLKKLQVAQLPVVADEIRELILKTVFANGGHLSSNLGIVETVIAVHYVFNAPYDKIIFDVGHQCYAHKILTGRRDSVCSLRLSNGIAGFPRTQESEYDVINTGHASTSLSVACGLARANDDENRQIISVIGDGAMTGGLAFEALNDIACLDKKQIIILNDNEMSISKNVGLIASYLNKIRAAKKSRKTFAFYNLDYIGVVDGHDFNALIAALQKAKASKKTVLVHILTKKGKGYKPAEDEPEKFHGYSPTESKSKSFSQQLGQSLCLIAQNDKRVFAVTAAMANGTGLDVFENEFKDRFVDVGIAEAHAMCMSAGLALGGKKPYFAVYSTFLQRAYDQLIHDVCLNNLPVTVCVDRCGAVAGDGETHQGVFDISFLRQIPNLTVCCPKDCKELDMFVDWSRNYAKPLVIRYPKSDDFSGYSVHDKIEEGKWETVKQGKDAVIFATGAVCVDVAVKASDIAKKHNIDVAVVNARFVKPFDTAMLDAYKDFRVYTLEDGVKEGGFGEGVLSYYNSQGHNKDVGIFAYPDVFPKQGDTAFILNAYGLDAQGVADKIIGDNKA